MIYNNQCLQKKSKNRTHGNNKKCFFPHLPTIPLHFCHMVFQNKITTIDILGIYRRASYKKTRFLHETQDNNTHQTKRKPPYTVLKCVMFWFYSIYNTLLLRELRKNLGHLVTQSSALSGNWTCSLLVTPPTLTNNYKQELLILFLHTHSLAGSPITKTYSPNHVCEAQV